jgi:hypothetical protein
MKNPDLSTTNTARPKWLKAMLLIIVMLTIKYVQVKGVADAQKRTVSFRVSIPAFSVNLGQRN